MIITSCKLRSKYTRKPGKHRVELSLRVRRWKGRGKKKHAPEFPLLPLPLPLSIEHLQRRLGRIQLICASDNILVIYVQLYWPGIIRITVKTSGRFPQCFFETTNHPVFPRMAVLPQSWVKWGCCESSFSHQHALYCRHRQSLWTPYCRLVISNVIGVELSRIVNSITIINQTLQLRKSKYEDYKMVSKLSRSSRSLFRCRRFGFCLSRKQKRKTTFWKQVVVTEQSQWLLVC